MNKEKIDTYVFWLLRYAFAVVFFAAGVAKLVGVPMLVHEFELVGLGQWFRFFVGVFEIVAGVLAFMPTKRHFGYLLMLLASIGAFVAQIAAIHMDWVHTLVFVALTGILVYKDRVRFVRSQ